MNKTINVIEEKFYFLIKNALRKEKNEVEMNRLLSPTQTNTDIIG